MKAAVRRKYGSTDQLEVETIERPIPKEKEVLVKVHASTVNRTDCANLTAQPFLMRFVLGFFKPRQIVLGTDFAGEVIAVGEGVDSFQVHDRVMGFNDIGAASQAEYLVSNAADLFSIPEQIDYQQAAASLEGASYAYSFVHKVDIQAGQSVLLNGATGGIGSALLQFVRQYEVKITATCNTKNIELIRSLGADKIYDYTKADFTTDTEKYDYVFDAVGKSTFGKCKKLLKEKGVYISSELGPYAQNVFLALFTPLFGKKKVIFPIPYGKEKSIPYIIQHLAKGSFKPVIEREYPLEDIAQAYEYVLRGEKTGNVIIKVG